MKATALPAQESCVRRLINVFWLSPNEIRQLEVGTEPAPHDCSVLLGLGSGISLLKYPVVLHDSFSPQTELINVWLRVIMEGGGEMCLEKLLYITPCIPAPLSCSHSSPPFIFPAERLEADECLPWRAVLSEVIAFLT